MIRDAAQIILHQRFRTWRILAMVALIGAALVVSTDHSDAQTQVDVVTTDTSITLSWPAVGDVKFYWWQPGPRKLEKIELSDVKSWTATGLEPESYHEFTFWGAFFDSLKITTKSNNPPPPTPEVSIAAGASVVEGSDATFTLTATPAPTQSISVNVSPLQSGDFGVASAVKSVTITTSGTSTVTFSTTDDSVDEPDGSVTASIVSGTGYTSSTTIGSATVAIADNDVPELSIASDGDVTEGTAASFTITASPTPHTALSVDVGVSASGSFGVTTGTQTITVPTSGSQTFSVSTSGDSTDESDGSVTVSIGSGTGYDVSSSASSATATISDDDDPPDLTPSQQQTTPEVSITAGSAITEGSDATFTISVTPTRSATLDVSVTVSQTGTYASTGQQTVTIPTTGSYTLTVSTTNDSTDEPDGSIVATLGSGTGYTVSSSNGQATVAVSDDDDPPQPKAQQQSPQDQIKHCLTGNILQTVRSYYNSNKNTGPSFGKNWKRVLITFRDVSDGNLTPYTATEALESEKIWAGWKPAREAIQCIEAIYPAPPIDPVVNVAGSADVTEGSSITFTLTVTPQSSSDLSVSVTVSEGGSFTNDAGSRTVTVGTTGTASFTITTINDSTDEFDGTVTATVNTGSGYVVSSTAGAATVAVADDDAPAQPAQTNPTVSIADAASNEGDDLNFTVSLSAVQTSAVTLSYETFDGTAISHSLVDDYTAKSGTVTIPAGDSSATITIATNEDSDIEINDTFTVVLSNPPAGVTIGDDTATGTIRNDDAGSGGSIDFLHFYKYISLISTQSSHDLGVWENGDARKWTLRLRNKPSHTVTLRPYVRDARDARSLRITPEYLVFTPSNWSADQAFSIRHIGNWGVHQLSARIGLQVVEYPGYTTLRGQLVSMYDASRTNPFTQRKPDPNLLTEGDANSSLTYQVKLGAIPRTPITATVTNPDPGAVTVSPMSFVFNHENYDEFQDFTITPVADGDSDDEDVKITVTIPVPHPKKSSPLINTFHVVVEEPASPGMRVDPKALTLDEGNTGQYDVWVRTDPGDGKSVTVTPTFTGSDVTVSPATLTFTGGSTGNWLGKQRVTVTTVQDVDDDNEKVSISHAISGDGEGYSSQPLTQSVAVQVLDDEAKVEIEFDRNNNLVLDEGNTAGVDIRVRLTHDPGPAGGSSNQVVLTTHPSGTPTGAHLVADPSTLTFTTGPTGNWNDWQTLTIEPPPGKVDDGNTTHDRHWVKVALGMSPHQLQNLPGYPDTVNDVVARPIDVFYFDDEIADDLHLEHSALSIDEGGSAVKYKLTLGGDAGGPVTVTITNPDPTKLTVSPTTATFPYGGQGDWHVQEVTLTALDDSDPQDETLAIVHNYSVTGYANTQQTLTVTIDDDDQLGVSLSSATVEVDETSSTTYDISLSGDPGYGASVVVTPVSGDTTRLTVSGAVKFTGGSSGDWMTPQTITLDAPVDDNYKKDTVTITHTITGFAGVSTTPSVTATIADARPIYVTWTSDPTDRIPANATLNLTEGTPDEVFIHFDPELMAEGDFKDKWFYHMLNGYQGLTGSDSGPLLELTVSSYNGHYTKSLLFVAATGGESCVGRYPRPRSTTSKYCDTIPVRSDIDANTSDETRWMEFLVSGLPGLSYGTPQRMTVITKDTSIAMQAYPTALYPIEDVAPTKEFWVRLKRQPEAGVTVTVEPEIQSSDSTKVSVNPSSLTFDSTNWDTFQKFEVTASTDVDTSNENVRFKLKGTASDSLVIVPNVGIDVSILDDD